MNSCWDTKNGHKFKHKLCGCLVFEICIKCGEPKHLLGEDIAYED
jgi:hypothetical protein